MNSIKYKYKRYSNVSLGKKIEIHNFVILGYPPKGKKEGELPLEIGSNSIVRSFTTIYAGSKIGKNFQTGHYSVVREDNIIGDNVSLGITSELGPGNKIGSNVRIHSGCFLELTTIHNNVFIGPNTVFLDDLHPMCPKYKECVRGAIVEENVSIGGNVTILPGVRIGKNSLIGGGSVVTKNIPPNSVVCGNPGKVIKKINELKCPKNYFIKPYIWRE